MKNKQPIKIQLASVGSSLSSVPLLPSSCSICQCVGTAWIVYLGCKGICCIYLIMRTRVVMLSARTFLFCTPTQFIHSVSLLFPVVYLYKHYADMLSSVYAHILLTSKCHGFCWHVFPLPSWALLPRTRMMPEEDTKHMKSAIPAVAPRFERCTGKVESDMLLSLTRNDVFADQPRSHACVVTAQVWMLKQRESLTKRLFEHWLNISRSYKKQHGIEATVGKRGSRNQILCTAVTFFFFPFCGISLPCAHAD